MKFRIKDNAFEGLKEFNGIIVTEVLSKDNGMPIIGTSGKTKMYGTPTGGGLYLTDDQVETVS